MNHDLVYGTYLQHNHSNIVLLHYRHQPGSNTSTNQITSINSFIGFITITNIIVVIIIMIIMIMIIIFVIIILSTRTSAGAEAQLAIIVLYHHVSASTSNTSTNIITTIILAGSNNLRQNREADSSVQSYGKPSNKLSPDCTSHPALNLNPKANPKPQTRGLALKSSTQP